MLDVSNIHIPLNRLDGSIQSEERVLRKAILRRLHLTPDAAPDAEAAEKPMKLVGNSKWKKPAVNE